jgi:hypothetical protein
LLLMPTTWHCVPLVNIHNDCTRGPMSEVPG